MIPIHLVGKSAVQIADEITLRFISGLHDNGEDYIKYLEMLLLLAIEDALMNCEEVKELIEDGEYQAQQRAIAFLNIVLPKE